MKRSSDHEHLREIIGKDKACYIVLSCGEPCADGTMEVNMTYEGDPSLAAYLLDSARLRIESHMEDDLLEDEQHCQLAD